MVDTGFLNDMQRQLLEFVKEKHGEQLRKYTNTPYWEHPLAVSKLIWLNDPEGIIEVALCHDLFEDTTCNFDELYKAMTDMGYDRSFSYDVCGYVRELTDVFTTEAYPYLNRKKRKEKEVERMGKISFAAQSVKYADLIDNTSSIVEYDPGFAKTYLEEKRDLLNAMRGGNIDLLIECCATLKNAQARLTVTPIENQ